MDVNWVDSLEYMLISRIFKIYDNAMSGTIGRGSAEHYEYQVVYDKHRSWL